MGNITYSEVDLPSDAILLSVDNCQTVYLKQMKDPSNVFKETVEELFQHASTALSGQHNLPTG